MRGKGLFTGQTSRNGLNELGERAVRNGAQLRVTSAVGGAVGFEGGASGTSVHRRSALP